MNYGLIGEKLSHSFSKLIHEKACNYSYELKELKKDEVSDFMIKKDFNAINVTIPYKQTVIPYIDHLYGAAKDLGVCNTIVNKDGVLHGYNTDVLGLKFSILYHKIDVKDKNCVILGSGGTSKTAEYVLKELGAKNIRFCSREPKNSDTISYESLNSDCNVNIIVNTSPQGMYPNNHECLADLTKLSSLEAVVDCVYNPLCTELLYQAKNRGLIAVNGLLMLVAQACFAAEKFIDTKIEEDKIIEIYKDILSSLLNICFIGMPSCGKTLTSKALSEKIGRTVVDTDDEIVKNVGKEITEIFAEDGESVFRQYECNETEKASRQNGIIIATGGGAIKNSINIKALKQNGIVCYIKRDLDKLLCTSDRPLSKDKDAVTKLYNERVPLYESAADFTIVNNYDDCTKEEIDTLVERIMGDFREVLDNKWA